ncbi:22207_t:CDS:1, partial [Cetraspora pellucida]
SMFTAHKKSQYSKEVSLTKCKPRRPKKTETTAKKVCLTKHGPGRPKKTNIMAKKQKTE